MIVFLSSQLQPDVATIVVTPPSVLKMLPMIVGRSPTGFEVLSTIVDSSPTGLKVLPTIVGRSLTSLEVFPMIVDCSPRIVAKSATIVF